MGIVIPKLRKSAKGQPCTFRIPGTCNGDPATTVLCHAPSPIKGMGNKSDDYWAAFGCSACHRAIDEHHVSQPQIYWLEAIRRTWKIWEQKGLIVLPRTAEPRAKPIDKICPRRNPITGEVYR